MAQHRGLSAPILEAPRAHICPTWAQAAVIHSALHRDRWPLLTLFHCQVVARLPPSLSAQPAPSWVALASHMDPLSFGFLYIFPDSLLHVEKLKGRLDLNRSRERQVLGLEGCDGGWFWRHMGKVRSPLRASQVVGCLGP